MLHSLVGSHSSVPTGATISSPSTTCSPELALPERITSAKKREVFEPLHGLRRPPQDPPPRTPSSDKEAELGRSHTWPHCFADSSQCLDNGINKITQKASDCKQTTLWIDGYCTPTPSRHTVVPKKKEAEEDGYRGMAHGNIAVHIADQAPTCWYSKTLCLEELQSPSSHLLEASFGSEVQSDPGLPPDVIAWETKNIKEIISALFDTPELPSVENVICILHKCKKEKHAHYAMQVHSHICNNGLEAHQTVGNYIVPMHVECGSMAVAQQVFHRLVNQNKHSWTSLLLGLIDCGRLQDALILYPKMEEQSVHLSSYMLVALLQACAGLKDVERGKKIHVEIALKGFERDLPVGNTLVSMYAKCCSLSEARLIFDRLPVQDVVSWTALISGYAEHGPGKEALKCFEQMQRGGISPNAVTFACVLKACCSIGALDRGREFHIEIALKGFQSYPSVANGLIAMYAKCGSLLEAREVLAVLPVRDLVSWTTLIAGYAEHGPGQEALKCFEQMQLEGVSPDTVAFACSLRACSSIGAIDKGREIHKALSRNGFKNDLMVGNTLVGMYAKCGSLLEAQKVFNELPLQDCVSWTALIAGYAEHGPGEEAVFCFEQMQLQGVLPNVVTFACVLKACGSIEALERGREIHSKVSQTGVEGDPSVSSSLIGMYASCGAIAEARKVFDKVVIRDVVLWTALIAGYAEHGPGQEALKCFEQMQLEGVSPDAATFACSLKACSSIGAIDKGREIHMVLAEKGFQRELSVGNTLVGMYAKCGSLSEAREAFDVLGNPDLMSWTSLIAGYADHGPGQEALECFEQMQVKGLCVDAVTLACIVKACGNLGAIQKGREIHAMISEEEFDKDLSAGNSLISMYARCGALADAREVFDSLPVRDSVAWSSMMKGYCMSHEGNKAVQCFEDMQEQGVKPDTVTFTCLLTACSHASLVSKGLHYYMQMKEQYGVAPTVEHHTCMIDLLARSGQLYEAEKFLTLLCPLHETTWAALLTACKTYGDTELGLRCFQQLVKINAEDATWYVLMEDIYANAGSRVDACRIQDLRRHAGAKKKPATALIEVNKKVHEFVVGSNQSNEISTMLKALNSRIKEEGHMPNLDKILKPISDEEKEVVLCEHAEKLAIAFGLLSTPQGATLRVAKNLRMCNDCHEVSKIISKIESREIILRDTCCIHYFKDGLCSCGDLY